MPAIDLQQPTATIAELRRIVENHRKHGLTYTTLKIADVLEVLDAAERAERLIQAARPEDDEAWRGLRPAVRARLAAAVDHLTLTGSLNRADIMRIGEVTAAQASHDLREIKARCPGLLRYDVSAKRYLIQSERA